MHLKMILSLMTLTRMMKTTRKLRRVMIGDEIPQNGDEEREVIAELEKKIRAEKTIVRKAGTSSEASAAGSSGVKPNSKTLARKASVASVGRKSSSGSLGSVSSIPKKRGRPAKKVLD